MTSRASLTLRVDGDMLVASVDDGRTARIDLAGDPELRHALDALLRRAVQGQASADEPTAAALASVGEAASLRPETDVRPPAHSLAALTTEDARIPLRATIHGAPVMPLRDVLDRRRSRRRLGPLSLDDLSPLLFRAGRTRVVVDVEGVGELESRPYPSAGARHPTELVVAAQRVDGLSSGWWWFEPFTCQLTPVRLEPDPNAALSTLGTVACMDQTPAAAVFAVASFRRTLSRYPAGSTLVWRDAGVVLATVHLAATELGLASCIVGTSGIIQTSHDDLTADLGAVIVGAMRDAP